MRMGASRLLLFLFCAMLTHLVKLAFAQRDPYVLYDCSNTGNVSSNSAYRKNVNTLLSTLSSNTKIDYGFYNFSLGENSDRVNAVALCRGDLTPTDCRSCVNMSALELLFRCPNQKEGIVWYMNCTIRYSNNSIFGVMQLEPVEHLYWPVNATDPNGTFLQVRETLLDRLRSEAAASASTLRKFATGKASSPYFDIYALLQCTPDLNQQECSDCLNQSIAQVPTCCGPVLGVRVLRPSCTLRYEENPFYGSTLEAPPPSSSTLPPPAEGKGSNSSRTIIIIVAAVVFAVLIFCICTCIYLRIRKQRKKVEMDEINSAESLQFDFSTIRVATDNFSDVNKLGQGGFGIVYKGKFPNGQEIAVKRLSRSSEQGDQEFKNEILLVARLQHRNLVRLLGFCSEGNERLLVYEFMPNASLDHFIFDPSKHLHLDWTIRYKIIMGIARGLQYLHEDSQFRIIHRDLKTSNVLLDEEMNPKISDFGMARLFTLDQSQANTRRIVGTYGYMAPEYAMHGHFSVKSDVFSYGVLVLEIVCGRKNNYFQNGENTENLLCHAWKNWREGTASNLIDSTLRVGSTTEIMRCIHVGLLCVQEKIAERPTMASVLLMLNSYSMALSVPSRPAFLMHSIVESDMSSNRSFQASQNEASMTDPYPR
ncbi:putative receptor-like protein kinase At4g00960 isoform X1 [Juglans microcarpa x Juglans regia]|uniref:putative receptor-like protein kinase At4g00960 isoform X1 n=1 Tax=Juglans microcarpa x Juglans regia TaxID=2249226 RepID=UPI001B7E0778|nr:putative receptor-like protein kinase At4g00960 isoform X1 [Juglans microcarpa x Juglans regia]